MKKLRLLLVAVLALAALVGCQKKPTGPVTVEFWHAMTGKNAETVQLLCDNFNASQADYKIVPVFKGSYIDTMNAGIAAYRDQYRVYRALVFEAKALGTPAAAEAVARLDRRFEAELARMLGAFADRGVIAPCDCEAVSVAVLEAYSGLVAHRDAEGRPLSEERITAVMGSLLCGGLLGGPGII